MKGPNSNQGENQGGFSPWSWTPPVPAELNKELPHIAISRLLGRGGMGAVYEGVQERLERRVAVKLLPPEIAETDPSFAARFEREAKAMAKLNHQNIVTIYDFGNTTSGCYYFVMEFVDGMDLHRYMHSKSAEPELVLNAICQICNALDYAHQQGYVHRDIKPPNVFLNREGLVKVGDFGLAKISDAHGGATHSIPAMTLTGVAMGTPGYSAPEQLDGSPVDHRADVYSLGAMLYEMLTLKLPIGHFPLPSKVAGVDPRLDGIVTKAMATEPSDRFPTVIEMRAQIDHIRRTPLPEPGPVDLSRSATAAAAPRLNLSASKPHKKIGVEKSAAPKSVENTKPKKAEAAKPQKQNSRQRGAQQRKRRLVSFVAAVGLLGVIGVIIAAVGLNPPPKNTVAVAELQSGIVGQLLPPRTLTEQDLVSRSIAIEEPQEFPLLPSWPEIQNVATYKSHPDPALFPTIDIFAFNEFSEPLEGVEPTGALRGKNLDGYDDVAQLIDSAKYEQALKKYDHIIATSEEFAWEDWGAVFGAIWYERGLLLLKLHRFEEAVVSFQHCHEFYPNKTPFGKRSKPPGASNPNPYWEFALYQWGKSLRYIDDNEGAIEKLQQFQKIKNDIAGLKIRQIEAEIQIAGCHIAIGRSAQGIDKIQTILKNAGAKVQLPQTFYLLAIRLALAGWSDLASHEDPSKISKEVISFLDDYGSVLRENPIEQSQRGISGSIRGMAVHSSKAGLHSVALRLMSDLHSTDAILEEYNQIELRYSGDAAKRVREMASHYRENQKSHTPADAVDLLIMAEAWWGLGNRRATLELYKRFADNYTQSHQLPNVLCMIVMLSDSLDEVATVNKYGSLLMEQYPDHQLIPVVVSAYLSTKFRNRDYQECIDLAKVIRAEMEPGATIRDLPDYFFAASFYYLGDLDQSRHELEQYLIKYPNGIYRENATVLLANILVKLGAHENAMVHFERILREYPKSAHIPEILLGKSICCMHLHQYRAALETFDLLGVEYSYFDRMAAAFYIKGTALLQLAKSSTDQDLTVWNSEAILAFSEAKELAAVNEDGLDTSAAALNQMIKIAVENRETWDQTIKYFEEFSSLEYDGHLWGPAAVAMHPVFIHEKMTAEAAKALERGIINMASAGSADSSLIRHAIQLRAEKCGQEPLGVFRILFELCENIPPQGQTLLLGSLLSYYAEGIQGDESMAFYEVCEVIVKLLGDYDFSDVHTRALYAAGIYLTKNGDNSYRAIPFFEEIIEKRNDPLFVALADLEAAKVELGGGVPKLETIERLKRIVRLKSPELRLIRIEACALLCESASKLKHWNIILDHRDTIYSENIEKGEYGDLRAQSMFYFAKATVELDSGGTGDRGKGLEYVSVFHRFPEQISWAAKALEEYYEVVSLQLHDHIEQERVHRVQAYAVIRIAEFTWRMIPEGRFEELDRLREKRAEIEVQLKLSSKEIQEIEEQLSISNL